MYHAVLYTIYSPCDSKFNKTILVTITYFPTKSCDLSMISFLTRTLNIVKLFVPNAPKGHFGVSNDEHTWNFVGQKCQKLNTKRFVGSEMFPKVNWGCPMKINCIFVWAPKCPKLRKKIHTFFCHKCSQKSFGGIQ